MREIVWIDGLENILVFVGWMLLCVIVLNPIIWFMKNRKELLMMAISHFISIFSSLFLLISILFAIILTFSVILYQSGKKIKI